MPTILVVDDEPDILLLHRLNLESAGHRVVLAADGAVALERVALDPPDIVVLDVMMPVLDGWEVLERLRGMTAPPPVLVVSAKSTPADVQHALDLGAADYLKKPYDPEELLRRVATLLAATGQTGGDG